MTQRKSFMLAFAVLGLSLVMIARGAGWVTSGDAAISTAGDAAVPVNAITAGIYVQLIFENDGAINGQFTVDGTHFAPLRGNGSVTLDNVTIVHTGDVQFRRFAGGADMTGCWAYGH